MKPLTRGRIAAIDGSFGVGDLEDKMGQNTLNGQPSSAVNVNDRGTLPNGNRWVAGEMARRREDRVQKPHIYDDGTIDLSHEDDVIEEYAQFAMVPGEFAITWDDWAFKYLRFNFPVHDYREQNIWLNGFYEAESFHNVSSVGFKARRDAAEKGTVHGHQVTEDEGIGEDLRDGSYLNELRYTHFPENLADEFQAYLAASGYVEVYNPTDLTTQEFLTYVHTHVWPHTEAAEDDDEH